MNGLKKAVQVGADDDQFGKPLVFLDAYFRCKVSAQTSGGDLCIYEVIRMKKGGPLLHYHQNQDEWLLRSGGGISISSRRQQFPSDNRQLDICAAKSASYVR